MALRAATPPAAIRGKTLLDPNDRERDAALLVGEGAPLELAEVLADRFAGAVPEPEGAEAVAEPDSVTVEEVLLETVAGAADGKD